MLDEEGTVESFAHFGFIRPVLRPVSEPWFDVALVVDASRSMEVWQRTIEEFEQLIARHGAFGKVTRWRMLDRNGISLESAGGQKRTPSAVNDPRRRTLILVATNGVAAFWDSDAIARVFDEWSYHAPVAVLQLFSENRWSHTILGPPTRLVRATLPGTPNKKLVIEHESWVRATEREHLIPVPVLSLAAKSVLRWAESAMAMGFKPTPAVVFAMGISSGGHAKGVVGAEQVDARARVAHFRSIASAEAFRLACHLAAVPLTLPIMRIVHQKISRTPRIEDLAEVIASGLLERLTPVDAKVDPDTVLYDFASNVRDVLLGALRMGSVFDIRAKVQSMLKEFVEQQLGRSIGNFPAFVLDESGQYELPAAAQAFVQIERDLLKKFRLGRVSEAVRRVQGGASSEARGQAEALRRIAACHATHAAELDLGGLQLEALDDKILRSLCNVGLTALTSLDLQGNTIGDEGAKAIAAALRGLSLLDLRDNSVGVEGAKAIAAGLPSLISLNLWGNNIGDEGAKVIAAALPGLTSLNLGRSNVGDEGAKAIAAAALGLTSLVLTHNHIGDEGAKAIAAALPGLSLLDLRDNSVGVEGAKAIAAGLPSLISLNLWGNNIGDEGAKAIAAALPGLTSLNLGRSNVGDEGAKAIAAAALCLTSLVLTHNHIGDEGAKAIAAALPGLSLLDLGDNSVGVEGAKAIAAGLPSLISLNLWGNNIGDEGAKAIAAALPGLTSLNLGRSNVGDEGAKAIAAAALCLTSLVLTHNHIGDEGAKALLDAWSSRQTRDRLDVLGLGENGLIGLLPKEVLETFDADAILAAYRRFVLAQKEQALRPLNELKLLVVGNEAVGKTSLIRYLIAGVPRNEFKSARIVQHEKIEIEHWSPEHCKVQLNVWDFGGQEIMRGTHRFFLTERSLYLLVLEDRRRDDRSFHDWMKTIRHRGGASPVIVVINKSDGGKQDLPLDVTELREIYPNIVGFLRTSCGPGDWAESSIEKLRAYIVQTITSNLHLKHVRDPIPANWLRIKNRVSKLAGQRSVLSHADYVALCKEPGGGTEPINEENERRALLRLLHDLGAIVVHGLARDAPAARREINLVDPNWLTGAIYRIIARASSVDQEGEFARRQLVDWLDPDLYPPERHEFILDMMQDREMGFCFRLPTRDERYLMPEALPVNRRFYGQWPTDSLRFRYIYNYLPPGLIPRFIVESHQNLTSERSIWRTGAVLRVRDCDALVLADLDRQRVDIQVTGSLPARRAALNIILNDLDAAHALNPEADPIPVVPLPDRPDVHVQYQHLLMLEQRMGPNYSFFPDGAERLYEVRELLQGVRSDQSTPLGRILEPASAAGALAVESKSLGGGDTDGIDTRAQTQRSSGLLEAINGLFQAAKRYISKEQ
jgi:GTPase SAR1 family protein/Ran GTPase-activating protein (RanGAP) involved in mRNA processing and transport